MPLSLNEIRARANKFSNDWKNETRERAEKDTFWNEFFNIFGLNRRRLATFEEPAKRLNGKGVGFVDLFWKGTLIAEHKSAGKNLESAVEQATDYFHGLKDSELPRYIIVTDFAKIRFKDLEENSDITFPLEDLSKNIDLFGFISGYKKHVFLPEDPVNIKAAELMGDLHDSLAESGYTGTKLEIFLVRILFILFADDTQIWEKGLFQEYLQNRTNEDGTDTGDVITKIFRVLNTSLADRSPHLDETLQSLSYINGGLFAQTIESPDFNSKMRDKLLACAKFDWSNISPAVFGSLFQHVMNSEKRRTFGAHYTEEKNILKTIKPLFLDDLEKEFNSIKTIKNKNQKAELLNKFQNRLASLTFFDPACGCGNFLVIAYREIRKLELEVLKELNKGNEDQIGLSVEFFSKVNVSQFYGIEIEEFPAKIAETAMWLMDHLMNLEVSQTFGTYYARLPLKQSAKVVHANALSIDWNEVIEAGKLNYIFGNPPFVGHHLQNADQKGDMIRIFENKLEGFKVLDYVTCWYIKASELMNTNPKIKAAFVSTNSISQGEQVGLLWSILKDKYQLKISFAHKTFKWSSEAKGKAKVYCVIIGFGKENTLEKYLFEYSDIQGEPVRLVVQNINSYLVNAEDILIRNRAKPVCNVPKMIYGNKPTDDGNFLLSDTEKKALIEQEPNAEKYIRPFISAKEFLNNENRWCLWLVGISPNELNLLPKVLERVENVKKFRNASKAQSTREYSIYSTLFRQITQPESDFVLVPRVTSENRDYIPFGFFNKNNIVGDSCFSIPDCKLYHFGILTSKMHMAWVKYTCGRLKSDFRYSKDIVYNNFPWPGADGECAKIPLLSGGTEGDGVDSLKNLKLKEKIETLAQNILDTRNKYPDSTLADLYSPITMPPDLRKAHNELDKAVDSAYRKEPFTSDTERVQWLFGLVEA